MDTSHDLCDSNLRTSIARTSGPKTHVFHLFVPSSVPGGLPNHCLDNHVYDASVSQTYSPNAHLTPAVGMAKCQHSIQPPNRQVPNSVSCINRLGIGHLLVFCSDSSCQGDMFEVPLAMHKLSKLAFSQDSPRLLGPGNA